MEARAEIGTTDLDLVERARLRDEDAFADLVRPRFEPLLRLASAITGDEIDARDALQETLASAWGQLPSLRDTERFDAWLTRILVNACRLVLRRRRRRVREIRLEPSIADRPTETMASVLDRLALDRAFERIGTDERAILALHHLEERSVAEIAGLLGIPIGTVKSRLFAARAALARELRKEQP